MSKEMIAKVRELDRAACEGPWRHCCASGDGCGGVMVWAESDHENPVAQCVQGRVNAKHNMAFIAESRTLLPALADLAESEGRRADEAERALAEIRGVNIESTIAQMCRMDDTEESFNSVCADKYKLLDIVRGLTRELAALKGQ